MRCAIRAPPARRRRAARSARGSTATSATCYSNPNLDKVVAGADAAAPGAGTSAYKVAGFLLVNDSVFAGLLYGVQQYLVHPYVKGAGGNALYDNSWTGIRIVRH